MLDHMTDNPPGDAPLSNNPIPKEYWGGDMWFCTLLVVRSPAAADLLGLSSHHAQRGFISRVMNRLPGPCSLGKQSFQERGLAALCQGSQCHIPAAKPGSRRMGCQSSEDRRRVSPAITPQIGSGGLVWGDDRSWY